ncbi:5153_t:CDS:2, partial [Acaulospora morrowiae]
MELHDSSQRKLQMNRGARQRASIHTANTIQDQEQKRKTVFKAVLDSPFTVKWPEVSLLDQRFILDELCRTLLAVGNYRRQMKEAKRNKSEKKKNSEGKIKQESVNDLTEENVVSTKPKSIAHQFGLVIGINEVTKHVEQSYDQEVISNFQQRCARISSNSSMLAKNPSFSKMKEPLRIIFVCKADISPAHLISHLPIMASIADVLIVPLPSGSSKVISSHIGIPTVTVLGIKKISPEFDNLHVLIREKVMPVHISWLVPLKNQEISKKRKCSDEEYDEQEETIAGPSSSIKEQGFN